MDISKKIVGLILGLGLTGSVVAGGLTADAQVYQSGVTARSAAEALKSPQAVSQGLKIELSQPVVPKDLAVVPANGIGPVKIGFARDLPADFSQVLDPASLTWTATDDGGQTAVVTLKSPDAKALRLGIMVYQLPDTVQLRFFGQEGSASAVTAVTGVEVARVTSRDRANRDQDAKEPVLYWSPVIDGDTLGVEIYVPAGLASSSLKIALPQASHLTVSPFSEAAGPYFGSLTAEPCHQDVTCYWDRWGQLSLAVARMLFTVDGGTAACSGTLLNDLDPNTNIPYFLTARHCISTQSVASTLETYWFYQTKHCTQGQPNVWDLPSDVKVIPGGATLLDSLSASDMTLLRLDSTPPDGVVMAGWDATTPTTADTGLTGIHHPAADYKKITFMTAQGFGECLDPAMESFYCNYTPTDLGHYIITRTELGFLQGGSSGSGLFRNDSQRLVGTLTGGSWQETDANNQPNCGDSDFRNNYGRFDLAYNASFKKWLAALERTCELNRGDWNYCSDPACGPCAIGEGDCDGADECKSGLVCAKNVGLNYGFNTAVDVCEPPPAGPPPAQTCLRTVGDWEFCSDPSCGPCTLGQGDCDSNAECVAGLICLKNAGASVGLYRDLDVCGPASAAPACTLTNGEWQYCSTQGCGPCGVGKGDCDSDADCAAGLVCASNTGAKYGLPPDMDVCEAPSNPVCTKQLGDWDYCSDPACGPCQIRQGDCDSDAECGTGLICVSDVGEQFGWAPTLDVCLEAPNN